jgi:hypothetical protein
MLILIQDFDILYNADDFTGIIIQSNFNYFLSHFYFASFQKKIPVQKNY